jgi:surface antigen
MKKVILKATLILVATGLVACTNPFSHETNTTAKNNKNVPDGLANNGNGEVIAARPELLAGADIGGSAAFSMDSVDRRKMFRALDKPVGRPTQWVNQNTGVSYNVVATEKVMRNGNPYCRKYQTTATRGDREKQFTGTACVGADSNWQSAGE